jgi:hypothetical protein
LLGGRERVDAVGLPRATLSSPRALDLDDGVAGVLKVLAQPGAPAAGALDPEHERRAEDDQFGEARGDELPLGGVDERDAARTVFRLKPVRRASSLIDTPKTKCSRRSSAHRSTPTNPPPPDRSQRPNEVPKPLSADPWPQSGQQPSALEPAEASGGPQRGGDRAKWCQW